MSQQEQTTAPGSTQQGVDPTKEGSVTKPGVAGAVTGAVAGATVAGAVTGVLLLCSCQLWPLVHHPAVVGALPANVSCNMCMRGWHRCCVQQQRQLGLQLQ